MLFNIVICVVGDVGMVVGSLVYFLVMDVVCQVLLMVMLLLKMVLIISLLLLFVLVIFDICVFVMVSCVYFVLYFVDFWFELVCWIDLIIFDVLYGWGMGFNWLYMNFNIMMGLDNVMGDMLLNFVMVMMFIVLLMFWVIVFGWVGLYVGGVLKGLSEGSSGVLKVGVQGVFIMLGGKLRQLIFSFCYIGGCSNLDWVDCYRGLGGILDFLYVCQDWELFSFDCVCWLCCWCWMYVLIL